LFSVFCVFFFFFFLFFFFKGAGGSPLFFFFFFFSFFAIHIAIMVGSPILMSGTTISPFRIVGPLFYLLESPLIHKDSGTRGFCFNVHSPLFF